LRAHKFEEILGSRGSVKKQHNIVAPRNKHSKASV